MTMHRMSIGMCYHRTYPAHHVTDFARQLEEDGADQLWLIEDCFYTAGASLAGAALAVTERLGVGVGIFPARARTAAVTAMEIATLCDLAPGRVLPGIGHGVQSWMAQMGVRPASPLTALEEVITAVRRLLDGDEVSVDGDYVYLDGVKLDQPPVDPPPILAGVRGAKSLAMSGRVADGVVLAESYPSYARWALDQAGRPEGFHLAVFANACVLDDRREAYRAMSSLLASELDDPNAGLRALPFFDDLAALYARDGQDGLVSMPTDWWTEIGPIGTFDDAMAHLSELADAGVHSVGLWPSEDVAKAHTDADIIGRLARELAR